ncbi:cellular nucleic acid-binding protein homolog [Formica exsecta]|uniref:cellular nucleic acid-binding protein homolog n=1 Tax=Formica exsecta TaxID=72781 RepID=UPI001142D291|nr:cellular nucleic acid-binding protein homolog [Formica exsecta]
MEQRNAAFAIHNNANCQLCLKSGHDAKSCRQNNTTNNNKISVICQWCERSGHSANNCWEKQNEQRYAGNKTRVTCQICNNFGHIAKDCRSKLNQQTGSRNSLFCRYCKEQGHLLENCQLRHASNFRKKENNQKNYNGPSTAGAQQGSEREPHPSKTQVAK